jgi:hypothetical protein
MFMVLALVCILGLYFGLHCVFSRYYDIVTADLFLFCTYTWVNSGAGLRHRRRGLYKLVGLY